MTTMEHPGKLAERALKRAPRDVCLQAVTV